jgi:hypothetical protein
LAQVCTWKARGKKIGSSLDFGCQTVRISNVEIYWNIRKPLYQNRGSLCVVLTEQGGSVSMAMKPKLHSTDAAEKSRYVEFLSHAQPEIRDDTSSLPTKLEQNVWL